MALIAQNAALFLSNVKQGFKSIIPIAILLVYTFIGALIFVAIEVADSGHSSVIVLQTRY